MLSDLAYESLTTVSDLIRRRQVSSVEVTNAILQRIAKLDGQYHSYATVLAERALDRATGADAESARGLWRGPLHGVPIAVKDLCYTTFAPTSAGTTIFRSFVPSYNATVVDHRGRRRSPPRKAANDRGGVYVASAGRVGAQQSVEYGLLGRLIPNRVWRRV